MRRWFIRISAGISAVVFAVFAGLFVASFLMPVRLDFWNPTEGPFSISTAKFYEGRISVTIYRWENETITWRRKFPGPTFSILIPLVLTAVLPMVWFLRWRFAWRRDNRIKLGLCPRCGYDVRASSDRCSECGTIITNKLIAE